MDFRQNLRLSPANIRFTQDSVAICFKNGVELNYICEEIVKGNVSVRSFPPIKVFWNDDREHYYSIDNRRLYVFRVLNVLGRLPVIEVRKGILTNREVTTNNSGCHVTLRNRPSNNQTWTKVPTYKHCRCGRGRLPDWWKKYENLPFNNDVFLNAMWNNRLPSASPVPGESAWSRRIPHLRTHNEGTTNLKRFPISSYSYESREIKPIVYDRLTGRIIESNSRNRPPRDFVNTQNQQNHIWPIFIFLVFVLILYLISDLFSNR